jgi:thioredoxin-like negative regulator of GroEL
MRLVLACLVVFLVPIIGIVGYRQYHDYLEQQKNAPQVHWKRRGEVLFFNASWCGPCRQMKPIVGGLRSEGYHLRDVDIDSNKALAGKYGIRSVPTFVFVENGKEVNRFSGGTSPDHLRELLADPAYR